VHCCKTNKKYRKNAAAVAAKTTKENVWAKELWRG